MSQEKHQMCDDGASGLGRAASKKFKPNKIPQRGLGVEKLERIRLEEQRKNSGLGLKPVIPTPLSRPRPGPVLGVPVRPPPQYQLPYPSAPRANLSSAPSSSSAHRANLSSAPSSSSAHRANYSSAPSVTVLSSTTNLPIHPPNVARNNPVHPYVPNMKHIASSSNAGRPPAFRWQLDAFNSENTKFDTEYADGSSSDLDNPDTETWPPLTQQRQSAETDPSSALPEPPSVQNAYRNYFSPLYYEDKMTGMKRSWPFALDKPTNRLYPCLPTTVPSIRYPYRRFEQYYGYGYGNQLVRGGSTATGYPIRRFNYMGNSLQQVPNKRLKEKAALDGDSLTLAPPATNSIASSSTIPNPSTQPIAFPSQDYNELSKINMPLFRGKFEEEMQQHYNYLTSKEEHNDEAKSSPKEEPADDDLDLELKL